MLSKECDLMKKKVLIVSIFIVFALPIPIAMLGCLMAAMWFLSSLIKVTSFVEIISALIGALIGATYIISYIFALNKTWNDKKFSIKSFLPVAHCLLALIYLFSLKPTSDYIDKTTERFGFAKRDFTVIEELDTHGGFLGDGSYYLILDCSNNKEQALDKVKGWNKLPLSENLNLIMYGGEKDGVTYGYELAKEAHMPKISNGYYMFEDRHSESKDNKDDSDLLDRHSSNFSVAIYDCDTDRLYYFEFDT